MVSSTAVLTRDARCTRAIVVPLLAAIFGLAKNLNDLGVAPTSQLDCGSAE